MPCLPSPWQDLEMAIPGLILEGLSCLLPGGKSRPRGAAVGGLCDLVSHLPARGLTPVCLCRVCVLAAGQDRGRVRAAE